MLRVSYGGLMVLLMDNLKSISLIWESLAVSFNVAQPSINTFNRRIKCEGQQFLYKDLTLLGKAFDRAVITGEPFLLEGRFKRLPDSVLPLFLSELFLRVLGKDGILLVNADPYAIKHIRQLLLLCYKTKVTYDELCMDRCIKRFIGCDSGIIPPSLPEGSYRKARSLIAKVLMGLDPLDIRPCHGSGATACRTPNQDKYHTFRHVERLNKVYPYDEYFTVGLAHVCDKLQEIQQSEYVSEPSSRIVAVPKDMRGPRLICCEPREHQYIQQGLMRLLYRRVERHRLTAGFVNFTDQTINQRLAQESSVHQMYATLDLKDASDLVQWDVVKRLFPSNWVQSLDACRTRFVEINGHTYGPLRKFAPMGSAVCFPVEALVFWSILKAHLNCDVWVYGDDIILPLACVKQAMDTLQAFGLVVNVDKSCYKTPFRESCGGDYFSGVDVSYVKIREEIDNTIVSHVATVEFVNLITKTYGECLGRRIADIVDDLYGPHFTSNTSSPLAYYMQPRASNDVFFRRRWNNDLQRYEYLVPTIVTKSTKYRTHSTHHWGEMLRYFCTNGGEHYRLGEYTDLGHCTKKPKWRSEYSD